MGLNSVMVDSKGNFILTGTKCDGGWSSVLSNCVSVVVRLTPAYDTTFGVAGSNGKLGIQYVQLGTAVAGQPLEYFETASLDAKGNILVAGRDEGALHGTFARILAADGSFDPAFGTAGKVTNPIITGAVYVDLEGVGADANGFIHGLGIAEFGGQDFATHTRLTAAGVIDTTYGNQGTASTQVYSTNGVGMFLPDGRTIMIASEQRNGTGSDMALLRFWP